MSGYVFKRKTCRLCGSQAQRLVVPLAPIPIATPNVDGGGTADGIMAPLDLYLCDDCGALQLLDVVDPEFQYTNFRYTTSISLGLPEHFQRMADEVLEQVKPPSGALVVEFGSNDGTLLRGFKNRGMRVLGVDPARDIARRASESGIPTLAEFFTRDLALKIRAEHGPAAIVISNNTFANLDEPGPVADGVAALLTDGGCFVFETSYGGDVVTKNLIDTVYHEHLSYFTARPLLSFFDRHGMSLTDMRRIWTKGGSIRGFVTVGRDRPPSQELRDILDAEATLDRESPNRFTDFANFVQKRREELCALLDSDKAAGRRIVGYGASVGSVTLIHQLDLARRLDALVDDNRLASHCKGPGYDIPIVPPDTLYDGTPATVVILAWRYAQPIMEKHPQFLAQGGRFVVPFPDLAVR